MMIAEIGHFCLLLSLAFLLMQSLLWLWKDKDWVAVVSLGRCLASLSFFLITVSYLCLIWSFLTSDYSVVVVAKHSHGVSPWFYKVAASWGHHEGSLLLWLWVLCGYGMALAFSSRLRSILTINTLVVHGAIASGLCVLIAFFSNPFLRLAEAPFQGQGFNPLLQDFAILFHPPLLYVGYVGISTLFSLAAGYLLSGKGSLDERWVKIARPFLLFSLIFLTLGITLGGWWSYYELGWGGFWAWDPVENASLLPWLVAIVLFHLLPLLERGKCQDFCWWLCAFAFFLSMFGTFLVRSGLMISLHSFAYAPDRGVALLVFLMVCIVGACIVFFQRKTRGRVPLKVPEKQASKRLKAKQDSLKVFPRSRSVLLLLQALFLLSIVAIIMVTLLMPIISELLGSAPLSVGSVYFGTVLWPFGLAILFLAMLVPWTSWEERKIVSRKRLFLFVCLCVLFGGWGLFWSVKMGWGAHQMIFWWAILFPMFAVLLTVSVVVDGVRQNANNWPRLLGHMGMVLLALGLVGSLWRVDGQFLSQEPFAVKGHVMRVEGIETLYEENFHAIVATVQVDNGERVFVLSPEKRYYPLQQRFTREVAMRHTLTGDWYVSMGEQTPDGYYSIHVSFIPLIWCIWGGMACFCFGFLGSLKRAILYH